MKKNDYKESFKIISNKIKDLPGIQAYQDVYNYYEEISKQEKIIQSYKIVNFSRVSANSEQES